MAQLRDIKKRIKSINNTKKVTHAMELVAATKMRRAQEAALSSRPYTNTLNQILTGVRQKSHDFIHKLLVENHATDTLIILITTDRGLVGGLNLNLIREILRSEIPNIQYVAVGKKGLIFATKTSANTIASFQSEAQTPLNLARTLTKIALDSYTANQVGQVKIAYPNFLSTIKQIPTITQVLPIQFDNQPENPTFQPANYPTDLLFEPSADEILENILPHYVLTKIYQALLEAKASEHSARMVAMKNATDAAGDLIDDLTLTYNQVRQETITKELLDIVTAKSTFE